MRNALLSCLVTGIAISTGIPAAAAYEICTPQNDYLENLLPSEVAAPPDSLLPMACLEAAHLSLAPAGYYGFCPTPDGVPRRSHPRPCISYRYVSSIYSALTDVADCLGADPREGFATFNLESAAHLNAVGAATDAGIGQLTKTAIDEVTANALPRAIRNAQASSKSSCQRILPFMTAYPSSNDKRCGFISLPENPLRNLIYSLLLIDQHRRSVDRYWARLNIQLPATVDPVRIKERLVHLAYNAGPAGGVATLKSYADLMGPRLNDRLLHFESGDFYGFPRYMRVAYPVATGQEPTRKRISKYVGYVAQAARRVERLAGTACFDPLEFTAPDPSRPVAFGAWKPDFQSGARMARRHMLSLALAYLEENREQKDCSAKQTGFLIQFLPSGSTEHDLPSELAKVYSALCKSSTGSAD